MAVKGYSSVALIEQALGKTLSAAQRARASALIESAELVIDRYKNQSYGVASITGEKHLVAGGWITLEHRPMTAITALTVTAYPYVAALPTSLVNAVSYELMDATEGLIYLGEWYDGYLATVSYTAPETVPANVRDACTEIVVAWLRPTVEGIASDVASYSISGDLSVTYRGADGAESSGSIPSVVYDLLGRKMSFA